MPFQTKSKDKKVEIILPEDKGERQPLRTLNANGAQENRGVSKVDIY